MTFKRWMALLLTLLCLAAATVPVAAENEQPTDSMQTYSKIYSLVMTETAGTITPSPDAPTFWEYPILRAGEVFNVEGTMIVKNDGDTVASMVMEPVALPYGDEAKLTYLDNLMLTVKEGDTVLFDNTYAHINDAEGGLSLIYNDMQPGEEHVYTIRMHCLYTYPGEVTVDAVPMSWTFSAKKETVTIEEEQAGMPDWLLITVITFGVIIAALVVIMVVRAIMNLVAKKKKAARKKAKAAAKAAAAEAPTVEEAPGEFAPPAEEPTAPTAEREESQDNAENSEKPVDNTEEV